MIQSNPLNLRQDCPADTLSKLHFQISSGNSNCLGYFVDSEIPRSVTMNKAQRRTHFTTVRCRDFCRTSCHDMGRLDNQMLRCANLVLHQLIEKVCGTVTTMLSV